ncbi:MAG: hypothetical protein V1728_05735 [Candidatus Micrarchaeota archaeon]
MVSMTVSIDEEIRQVMKKFPEINWSGFVSKAIEQKVHELQWREEMLQKLEGERELDDWAVNLARDARKGRFEQLKKQGLVG